MNGDINDLRNFEIAAPIVLDNRQKMNRMQATKGRFSFNAATKTFTLNIQAKMINQTLSIENILPLQKKQCPNGRVYVFQIDKPGFNYNEVFLRDIAEGDKALVHNTLLKLVGVHRGLVNCPTDKGNKSPLPNSSSSSTHYNPNIATHGLLNGTTSKQHMPQMNGFGDENITMRRSRMDMPRMADQKRMAPSFAPSPQEQLENAKRAAEAEAQKKLQAVNGTSDGSPESKEQQKPPLHTSFTSPTPTAAKSNGNGYSPTPADFQTPPNTKRPQPASVDQSRLSAKKPRPDNDKSWLFPSSSTSRTPINKDRSWPYYASNSLSPVDHGSDKENQQQKERPPPRLDRPDEEEALPEQFVQPDFWASIKRDEKIRAGFRGEWVKGQDEHLTVEGLLCLKDGEWLNADMIDAYLSFICREHAPRVRYIPTYAILSYNRKKKIPTEWYWQLDETVEIVLAPAHLNNNHWAMAIVEVQQRRIQLMDSMNNGFTGDTKQEFMKTILSILMEVAEAQQVHPQILGPKEDWFLHEQLEVPQQMNGTDCGIFALLYARFAAARRQLHFSQTHIPYYRRRLCHDIIRHIA